MEINVDKRTQRRATWTGLVDIRKTPKDPPSEALLINVSFGGLGIYSKELIKGKVHITFYFLDKRTQFSETIWGEVVRIRKLGSYHVVGIKFIDLNVRNHKGILSLVEYATSW